MKGVFDKAMPALLAMTLATVQIPAGAAPQCKGMNKVSCSEDASCIWVNGYVTRNGTEVDDYCRVKSTGKQSKAGEKRDT